MVGSEWLTTTHTPINEDSAVIFSVKCFSKLKLYHLSGNILR